ncbi:uncharacterized protein L969DRAFT_75960, partial [Mixia osmundae IAM 14324]
TVQRIALVQLHLLGASTGQHKGELQSPNVGQSTSLCRGLGRPSPKQHTPSSAHRPTTPATPLAESGVSTLLLRRSEDSARALDLREHQLLVSRLDTSGRPS